MLILAQKDFSESDLTAGKDKQFINNFKENYQGDFWIDSKIIKKKNKTFLTVFIIAGKY